MILEQVNSVLGEVSHRKRPTVTLAWAQSINGIASNPAERGDLAGSSAPEIRQTLRNLHQGLLVGIGTILASDPELCSSGEPGGQPQPIILDTKLRISLEAKVLNPTGKKPWIFHSEGSQEKIRRLQEMGAWVFHVPYGNAGVSLGDVLGILAAEGMKSLLVEGGTQVISSFVRERQADQILVTLCPLIMPGLPGIDFTHIGSHKFNFSRTHTAASGTDTLYWGQFKV